MSLWRVAVGLTLAAVAAMALSWLSNLPIAASTSDEAVLRLAWRARPERIEHCVEQSAEALAALPPHMRQATVCEGINASYRLQVRRNGALVLDEVVQPGGLRRDRPLYVFREIATPTGEAVVRVSFLRVEAVDAGSDDEETRGLLREAVPASLDWEARLPFGPRQVHVVSYDPEHRRLFEVKRDQADD